MTAWSGRPARACAQQVRTIYHAVTTEGGKALAEGLVDSLPSCPISEVARLGRTLRSWRGERLAYFDTGGASNGPTEALNLIIAATVRASLRRGGIPGASSGDLRAANEAAKRRRRQDGEALQRKACTGIAPRLAHRDLLVMRRSWLRLSATEVQVVQDPCL